MIHKSHDEVFQELCKEFPGLMDYLLDGHLEEVGKLTEKVRDLGNALASADARCSDRGIEANLLMEVNKGYEDLIRRIGLMLDREQLNEPDRTDHDLVSCAVPVTVALDLVKIARPLIVAKGEEELQMNENRDVFPVRTVDPSLFALHQNGKISDSTALKMLMGVDPGLAKDETVLATFPVKPGMYIERLPNNKGIQGQAVDRSWSNELAGTFVNSTRGDTMFKLKIEADFFLRAYGWACADLTLDGHGCDIDMVVVAAELQGAVPVNHKSFVRHMQGAVKRLFPISSSLNEVTLMSHETGESQALMPSKKHQSPPHFSWSDPKKVTF